MHISGKPPVTRTSRSRVSIIRVQRRYPSSRRYEYKFPPDQPDLQPGKTLQYPGRKFWSARFIKHGRQGACTQFIKSNFNFSSACFTVVPRYMRRIVTMTACERWHQRRLRRRESLALVQKVD